MATNMLSAVNAYNSQLKLARGEKDLAVPSDQQSGPSFSDLVENQINDVIDTQHSAEKAQIDALTGKGDITDLVTAIANAEMALNTIVTIRDRAISAYQDIIRMPM